MIILWFKEGDVLEIPTQPESVHLIGGVQQGISIAYNPSFKTNDYISNVGGFTKYADKSNIYVFKTWTSLDEFFKIILTLNQAI